MGLGVLTSWAAGVRAGRYDDVSGCVGGGPIGVFEFVEGESGVGEEIFLFAVCGWKDGSRDIVGRAV